MNRLNSARGSTSRADRMALGGAWQWFLALGIGLTLLGAFAIGWICFTQLTVAGTWLFGFLLIAGGVGEIVNCFHADRWSGSLVHLLTGTLYTLFGFLIIDQPADRANLETRVVLIIAVFLLICGIIRIVFAVSERFTGAGWLLLSGAIAFLMGLLIIKGTPIAGLWAAGLFVGLELFINGISWILVSLGLRRTPVEEFEG